VGDPHWLDNRWAEKDRILAHFGRTGQFPLQVSQITQPVSRGDVSRTGLALTEGRRGDEAGASVLTSRVRVCF
jgi:hypothetical protein